MRIDVGTRPSKRAQPSHGRDGVTAAPGLNKEPGRRRQEPDWSGSTVQRELQFLVSHTVHHCALIKQILRQHGFEAGMEFGLAPSTKGHLQRQAACAR